jgi:hypothetical protein
MNNLNKLNFDIKNYSNEELENILKIKKPYTKNNLFDTINTVKNEVRNSNLSDDKRELFNIFLDNVNVKLSNELNTNERLNKLNQYDGNHFIIQEENKTKSTTSLESNKKINKSIIKKSFTVDSMYRQDYSNPTNQSHNFIITLPETINNAMTMSISSLELPLSYHNISLKLNNNVFDIEVFDGSDNIISELSHQISLLPGLYEARFTSTNQIKAADIASEINKRILEKYVSVAEIPNISTELQAQAADMRNCLKFNVNIQSGACFFSYDSSNATVLKLHPHQLYGEHKIKINFNTNNSAVNNFCTNNFLYQKLGWQLGYTIEHLIFQKSDITFNGVVNTRSQPVTKLSQGICNINYPRYLYIGIDDFQTSSRNFFTIAAESVMAPNIIGRVNVLSMLEDKTAYKSGAVAGDYFFSQKHVREYFGPTNIKRLKISLIDQYGREFSINNSDWSFVVTFECLYN